MEPSPINRQNRNHRVMVRLSEAEFGDYMELTRLYGATRSEVIRKLLRERKGESPHLVGKHLDTIAEGIYQLGALGRNLNQELRLVHSGQMTAKPVDIALIAQIKDHLAGLENEWLNAVQRSKNPAPRT